MKSFIQIRWNQFKDFADGLKKSSKNFPNDLKLFIAEEATLLIAKIEQRTPVDSGRLRASWKLKSIKWNGDTLTAIIENDAFDGNANYADFVEYGHHYPYQRQYPYTKTGTLEAGLNLPAMPIRGYYMASKSMQEFEQKLPKKFEDFAKRVVFRFV